MLSWYNDLRLDDGKLLKSIMARGHAGLNYSSFNAFFESAYRVQNSQSSPFSRGKYHAYIKLFSTFRGLSRRQLLVLSFDHVRRRRSHTRDARRDRRALNPCAVCACVRARARR